MYKSCVQTSEDIIQAILKAINFWMGNNNNTNALEKSVTLDFEL
jgi:hypothetical protein